VCVYIYVEREREGGRERENDVYTGERYLAGFAQAGEIISELP